MDWIRTVVNQNVQKHFIWCPFGKGAADAAVAYACDDGVCFVVSCVGYGIDALQFRASFAPGPNITTVVTLPISVACKTFVMVCKNQILLWKKGC